MFYVIIGQSGSGKTTFVRENFIKAEPEVFEDIIPLTRSGDLFYSESTASTSARRAPTHSRTTRPQR